MKYSIFFVLLFLFSCAPDPQPRLENNVLGKWDVYNSGGILFLGSSLGPEFDFSSFELEILKDGKTFFEKNGRLESQWRREGRDHIIITIPEGLFLDKMEEFEMSFFKRRNDFDSQSWAGSTSFVSDTARENPLNTSVTWELSRIE